eukprot:265264-Amphidinium_carterae.1
MHQDKFNNSQFPTWTISLGQEEDSGYLTQKGSIHPQAMLVQSGSISRASTTSHSHGWNLTLDVHTWWSQSPQARCSMSLGT